MAAEYCNVSATMFDHMVADGRMPRPKAIGSRRIWLRTEIDAALFALEPVGPTSDVEEADTWDDFEVGTAVDIAKTHVTQWERILLTALLRRGGGPVDASTIEGAGPTSRKNLASRDLIKDDGTHLELTAEGIALARQKSGLSGSKVILPSSRAAKKINPNDFRAPEWHRFVDGHSPEELARPMGKREMSVMKQIVDEYGGQAEHWQLRGAGAATAGLLHAKQYVEAVDWDGKEFLRATPAGQAAYLKSKQ
ncbi:hypothetical protein [Devosia sp. 919]|uniref:helix-turn-helix transcriptional regulator n=1 Tax=Devosia sp. 919 TaxID=2726065 RepID=UPI001555647B|nr:hypothetical protein [Devosia sp. 919]